MGADAETLNQWTPAPTLTSAAPALGEVVTECGCRFHNPGGIKEPCERHREPTAAAVADGWESLGGGTHRWASACGRVSAMVWFNAHNKDWRYKVDWPDAPASNAGLWAMDAACARDIAFRAAQERLAELDKAAPPSEPSKWHPIAESIAATVAEKNAAYGDSVTRSAAIMQILYPDGIPVDAYKDALLVVRVLDKLSRIATDRDALGESPWRDIAGYALLACERGGK